MMLQTKTLALILLISLISGCSSVNEERTNAFQSLTQSQQAAYWQTKKVSALLQQLKASDATVYIVGDEYEIIIPADLIFNGNTPQLIGTQKPLFSKIIALINAQSTPAVEVLAYTNLSTSAQRNFSLTQSWAETVVTHLREQGLGVALLSARGHGECDHFGKENGNMNRIEIHYRVSHED